MKSCSVPWFRHFPAAPVRFLAALAVLGVPGRAAEPQPAQRVVLVSVDTLRQDHLSLYGYPRPTTPNLEKLAGRSAVFCNAMAQAPYTLPSHMSMFTGLNPWAHGVRYADEALVDSYETITEILKEAGFSTAAFVDCSFLESKHGFAQGFDLYQEKRAPGGAFKNGFRRYGMELGAWIQEHKDERFFLFIHTFDTHGPYQAEAEYKEALAGTQPVVPAQAYRFGEPLEYLRATGYHDYHRLDRYETLAQMVNDYDAAIRFVDQVLGLLIASFDHLQLFDDALLIVTSDHGESFLDHQMYVGHGLTLYEEEVRVPLLVKFPGGRFAGVRCDDVVRLIDLYPTITAATRTRCPDYVQGADLALALLGEDPEPRIAFGESPNLSHPRSDGFERIHAYARRGDIKYISPPGIALDRIVWSHLDREALRDRGEKYDLEADPLRMKERVPTCAQLFDLGSDRSELKNLGPRRQRDVRRIEARVAAEQSLNMSVARSLGGIEPGRVIYASEEELDALFGQGYISSEQLKRLREELRHRRDSEPGAGDR